MSIDQHRTDQVFVTIEQFVAGGQAEFRPGHLADALREAGSPMLTWEIRGELSRLEAAGLIASDPRTGTYTMVAEASRKTG